MRHIARKRFGQHFLTDPHYIAEIIHLIRPIAGDHMIEIGPGRGALTGLLLKVLSTLQAIEIDRDMIAFLQQRYADNDNLVLHNVDVLKFDFSQLGEKLRIVGNLPYNISTPLLFHLIPFRAQIIDMYFMLQQEVVARMVAQPSTSAYGRLSVMLQNHFVMEQLLTVPPQAFTPPPKVQSAIVSLHPRTEPIIPSAQEDVLSRVVSAAFAQRRKTLRNTLRAFLTAEDFIQLQIDSNLRAENLSLEQFAVITGHVYKNDRQSG